MEQKDYYEILGVDQEATAKQIKDTYRKLALQFHPDRNPGDAVAAEKMKVVNEAYAVLSDPEKRREYNDMRRRFGSSAYTHFRRTYSEQDIFTGSDIHGIFEELARSFGLRGFDEIFKEFYGQGFQTYEIRGDGGNGRRFVFSGSFGNNGDTAVNIPSGGPLGKTSRYLFKKITGIDFPVNGSDLEDVITVDPEEARRGGPYEYLVRRRNKRLKIALPPGVRDGQKIRISGMGESGSGGAQSGDLYLTVRIKRPLLQKVKAFITGLGKSV
ncbi:MAG: DnaJ domain-containing protein [Deltaproteobacteria bacterium]|nr:DnaJ domain-containing protein [Deltaproteobacteria bacterium]MBN2688650.1 DnaJ domain-containing protein [Deltaproteobacteria bacterium]